MSIETLKENPSAKAMEAAKQALAAEAPTNALARLALDQLSATIEPDAIRLAITTVQASPDYPTLSAATRGRLDALRTNFTTTVKPAESLTGQAAELVGKTWNKLPWYAQIPLVYGGIRGVQTMAGGVQSGAKAAGSWVGNQWEKVWGFMKWSAKAAALAGTGILAGIGIKTVYDGTQQEKPKVA